MVERAAVYCRISRDPDGDMLGVGRQREDCLALAERRGWGVAGVYVDDDVSAYSGRRRPEYERMLADLRTGTVDAVVVYHLDRLHRRPAELEEFFAAADAAGVKELASCSGDVDLSTAEGQFQARILGAVAAKESADKSRRIKRQRDQLAAEGKPVVAGRRPFGYERDMVTIRPEEAALVRELVDRFIAGETIGGLVRWLNDHDHPTPSGGRWQSSSLKTLIGGARIAGLRVHRGEVVGEAAWPAIIDRQTHERIRARMGDPRRPKHDSKRSRLLSTLLVCGECGTRMAAKRERRLKSGPRAGQMVTAGYQCSVGGAEGACGRRAIRAAGIEGYVSGLVLQAIATPGVATAARDDDELAGLTAQLRGMQDRLDEMGELFADGLIDASQLTSGSERLRARMATVRGRLRRADRAAVLLDLPTGPEAVEAMWDAAGMEWRRTVVRALVDRVVIGPGVPGAPGFQKDRVEVVWRMTVSLG